MLNIATTFPHVEISRLFAVLLCCGQLIHRTEFFADLASSFFFLLSPLLLDELGLDAGDASGVGAGTRVEGSNGGHLGARVTSGSCVKGWLTALCLFCNSFAVLRGRVFIEASRRWQFVYRARRNWIIIWVVPATETRGKGAHRPPLRPSNSPLIDGVGAHLGLVGVGCHTARCRSPPHEHINVSFFK